MRSWSLLVPCVAVVVGLTACDGSPGSDTASGATSSSAGTSSAGELTGTLTVFAAASLTDVFGELGHRLTAANPHLDVTFNFAGSSALATQITQGAPADVFASANQTQMTVVTDEHLQAGDPQVFTENVLEIAVPKGNPQKVADALGGGAAASWILQNRSGRMIANDYPLGFRTSLHLKDLGIALGMAREVGAVLPLAGLAQQLENGLVTRGYGDEDNSNLARAVRELSGLT